MTASTYPRPTDELDQPSSMGADSGTGIGHQLADVAAAMFGLLLLQTPEAHQDIPSPEPEPEAEPAHPAAAPSAATAIALPQVPLACVEQPPQEQAAAATQPLQQSIPMPSPIPMPDLPLDVESTTEDLPVPVTVPEAPRSMALLSEIGFLDD